MSSLAPAEILSAQEVARTGIRRSDVSVANGTVYWLERRPREQGRSVIVRSHPTLHGTSLESRHKTDVVSTKRNVRSVAHEYGGACYVALRKTDAQPGERLVFTDYPTRSIFLSNGPTEALAGGPSPAEETELVLLEDMHSAYADFIDDSTRDRVICVREHYPPDTDGKTQEPIASIVAISLTGQQSEAELLIDSRDIDHDFLSTPRVSPDGRRLACLAWRHPNMPWNESELWIADLDAAGRCSKARKLAGGDGISIFQPGFSPDGTLHYVSDQTGWWNIYRLSSEHADAKNLTPLQTEFALPQWVFGMSTYAIPRDDLLVAIGTSGGTWKHGWLDPTLANPEWHAANGDHEGPTLTWFDSVAADSECIAMLAAGPHTLPGVLAWSTEAFATRSAITSPLDVDAPRFEGLEYVSIAVGTPIEFDSPHALGPSLGSPRASRRCHAFYYPPAQGTAAEGHIAPPLIVRSHGGPTGATDNALDPAIQFWTSRGFAIADVNYGGSTGYGTDYRRSLDGKWGVVDVEDCAAAALFLVDQGLADRDRLIIRGGSAGGYTTLAALTFTDTFCAGASLYGIGDLETLARDTHKFESLYLDRLIGPYPDERELYRSRSPIHSAQHLSCPVIFFQGSEDKVVPPNQSETMYQALKSKGLATEYVLFEGEGHGFRRAENIITALERELAFYQQNLSEEP